MKVSTPFKTLCTALFSLSLVVACGSPASNPVQAPVTPVVQAPVTAASVVDVSRGAFKTPASFTLKIQTANGGFATKANLNGTASSKVADISKFDVYLIDSASAPAGAITPRFGPYEVTANLSLSQQTITFNNVPSSNNKFYVAIKAKDAENVNITNIGSGKTIGGEYVYVSTTGGDGAGQVGVNISHVVSSADALGVALKLKDALGATLESTVTVTEGETEPIDPVSAG